MSLTFRGTNIQTANIWLDVVRGYNEPAPVRGHDDVVPGATGQDQGARIEDQRSFILEGWVQGTGATELARQQSWRTATDALKAPMDHTLAAGALVMGAPDHGITGTKTINAKCVNAMPGPILNAWTLQKWSFELVSSSPEWASLPTFVASALGNGTGQIVVPTGGLTNSALFIAVGGRPFAGWPPTGVKYRIDFTDYPATLLGHVAGGTGDDGAALFVVLNPPSSPSMAGEFGTFGGAQWCGAWLWRDVNQASPVAASIFGSGTGTSSSLTLAGANVASCINAVKVYDGDFTNDAPGAPSPAAGQTQDWSASNQLSSPGYVDVLSGGGHGDASPGWTFDQSHPWTGFVAAVNGV